LTSRHTSSEGVRALGVIPARGGSKGVRDKNIRLVAGRPLIAYTIEAARRSKLLSHVIVSTEDRRISEVARAHDVEVLDRPVELAADDTPAVLPVLHALQHCPGYDYVVLLQPTSPLRIADDIDGALKECIQARAPACVSVCRATEHPYWMYRLNADGRMTPLVSDPAIVATRRQDLPPVYTLNGAVYVARCDWLPVARVFVSAETRAYVMPAERSHDIDTDADLMIAEQVLKCAQHADAGA
jgi:CMP-N,N'-diacetyllegionaminic acid synthase